MPAADPEISAEGEARAWKSESSAGSPWAFIILVVLVIVLMFSNSLRRTARITLPLVGQRSRGSGGADIAGGDSLTVVAVTPETVQTAIATLERPEQYKPGDPGGAVLERRKRLL